MITGLYWFIKLYQHYYHNANFSNSLQTSTLRIIKNYGFGISKDPHAWWLQISWAMVCHSKGYGIHMGRSPFRIDPSELKTPWNCLQSTTKLLKGQILFIVVTALVTQKGELEGNTSDNIKYNCNDKKRSKNRHCLLPDYIGACKEEHKW